MLMMCWFYCIPFTKGLFFAFSPLLILFSLFALKRGVRQSRLGLRQAAFLMMFAAVLKLFTVDVYLLKERLPCEVERFAAFCNPRGFKILQASGLAALVLCSLLIFHFYRNFIRGRRQPDLTPEQAHLRFWANLSMTLVMLLIAWLAAPWVGFLTVGRVPQLFMQVPWQHLAVVNMLVLLYGFWRVEDCLWVYDPVDKKKKPQQLRVWTARDTLWMSVILFVIALAFSYASNDALSTTLPGRKGQGSIHLRIDQIDIDSLKGRGFRLPAQ